MGFLGARVLVYSVWSAFIAEGIWNSSLNAELAAKYEGCNNDEGCGKVSGLGLRAQNKNQGCSRVRTSLVIETPHVARSSRLVY